MASPRHYRELIKPYNGRLHRFRDLPECAQLSLVQYMAVDGDAWSDLDITLPATRSPTAHANALRAVLPAAVERYGDLTFGMVTIPMPVLCADVLKGADIDFPDWASYHAWYLRLGRMPSYPMTRWPPILGDFPDETLQDGWHRLHDYYRKGDTAVTCLYFPR